MLDRATCERRVYRLAVLLTGERRKAAEVIEAVVDAQPDLRRLDRAHLDRLTVLRSRERGTAILVDDAVPHDLATTVAGLRAQPREAWLLTHVFDLPSREVARATDCSVTAMTRHLDEAEAALGSAGEGEGDAARPPSAVALRAFAAAVAVPSFYYEQRRRRRARRAVLRVLAAILIVVALVIAWSRWRGGAA